jgi:hypothetical protein
VVVVRACRPRSAAERFDAKVTVLMENVRHHIEEEQTDFFEGSRQIEPGRPRRRRSVARRETAPTHPHPKAPTRRQATRWPAPLPACHFESATTSAEWPLVEYCRAGRRARIMNSNKPKVSPTGSTVARYNQRSALDAAVDGAEQTARQGRNHKDLHAASAGAKSRHTAKSRRVHGDDCRKRQPQGEAHHAKPAPDRGEQAKHPPRAAAAV